MVPVVQHNGSEQTDARNGEHLLSLKGQTPVFDSSRFANAIEILFDGVEARIKGGEYLRGAVRGWRIEIRRRGVELVQLRELRYVSRNAGDAKGQLAERHRFGM